METTVDASIRETGRIQMHATEHTAGIQRPRRWVLAVALGLALAHAAGVMLNCSGLAGTGLGTAYSIFEGSALTLLVLALVNACLKRFRPALALTPSEFVVVYVAVTIAGATTGQSQMNHLVPGMIYPWYQSQPAEGTSILRGLVPDWMAPRDPTLVKAYFEGGVIFQHNSIFQAWLIPVTFWILFWGTILGMMYCLNTIFFRPWLDAERLTFPTTRLPLEMAWGTGFSGKTSGPMFYAGVGTGFAITTWGVLSGRFGWPPLTALTDMSPFFPSRPWNGLNPWWIGVWPFAVGISFFAPTDLLFSAWFFFFARKALEVIGVAYGWRNLGWDATGFPFNRSQAPGAWIGIFLLLILRNRKPLLNAFKSAIRLTGWKEKSSEDVGQAWAGRGLIIGSVALVTVSVIAGMQVWVAALFFTLYFVFTMTYTRLWAQIGPPLVEAYFVNPHLVLRDIFGTRLMRSGSLAILASYYWFNRTYVELPMAHQMEALYLGERTHVSRRTTALTIAGVSIVAVVVFLVLNIGLLSHYGQLTPRNGLGVDLSAMEGYSWFSGDVITPQGPRWISTTFILVGAGITLFLGWLSATFIGFPLHPAGYPLAVSYAMEYVWFSVLLAWLIKTILLRYWGFRGFSQAVPLFLGLILGELSGRPIWAMINLAWRS